MGNCDNFLIMTIREFSLKYRREIFGIVTLTVLALIIRLAVATPGFYDMPARFSRPDTGGYLLPALALVETGRFDSAPDSGEAMAGRPPGFPLLIALVFRVFGESYPALIVVLSVIGALTVIPVYLCGRLWGSNPVATVAGGLFALNITAIALSPMLLTDTLFAFFAAWQLYFFLLFHQTKRLRWCFVAIAIAALSALIRPIAMLWIFPGLFLIAIMPKMNARNKIMAAIGSLIIFYAILTPWMLRNYNCGAGFCIDTNTGAMYHQNGAMLLAKVNGTQYEDEKQRLLKELDAEFANLDKYPDAASRVDYRITKFRKLVFKHPFTYFSLHFSPYVLLPGVATFCELLGISSSDRGTLNVLKSDGLIAATKYYFGGRTSIVFALLPLLLIPAICYAGAAWQLFKWIVQKQIFMLFLFLAFVEYFLFLPGPITVPRYHLPALPLLAVMAAMVLVPTVQKISSQIKIKKLRPEAQ